MDVTHIARTRDLLDLGAFLKEVPVLGVLHAKGVS